MGLRSSSNSRVQQFESAVCGILVCSRSLPAEGRSTFRILIPISADIACAGGR